MEGSMNALLLRSTASRLPATGSAVPAVTSTSPTCAMSQSSSIRTAYRSSYQLLSPLKTQEVN